MSPAYDGGRRSKVSTSERDGEGHVGAHMHSGESFGAADGARRRPDRSRLECPVIVGGTRLSGVEGFRRRRSNVVPPRRACPPSRLRDA